MIRQQQRNIMASRRGVISKSAALGIVLTCKGLSTAGGHAKQRGGPPPYRPAPGAKDLRAALFNWPWHMGMLRGIDEHELVASLEHQAKGTDLTTVETETGQMYVVMPVPASVRTAIKVAAQPPAWIQESPASPSAQNQPTPRLANGKPDMTGNWSPTASPNGRYGNRRCGPTQDADCTPQINQIATQLRH
jgi:hypothetical protein